MQEDELEEKAKTFVSLSRTKKKPMMMDSEDMPADMPETEMDSEATPKKKRKKMAMQSKEISDLHTKEYVPMGLLSFKDFSAFQQAEEQAEEMQEMTSVFMQLVWNNLCSMEVKDKRKALLSLVDEYSAAIRTAGTEDSIVKEKTEAQPENAERNSDVLLIKEANGQLRWLAIYSNNFRDDDYPAEIISKQSHRTFTDLANAGLVPMPELWQWHVPGTRYGQADSLYFGDDGFALATGLVDEGKEAIAEATLTKEGVRVSHGMLKDSLLRDATDPSIIRFHVTKEISTLPGKRAANKLTGFTVKELDMSLPNDKKDWLKSLNYSDAEIAAIEAQLSEQAAKAKEEKRETKEAAPEKKTEPAAQTTTPAAPVKEDVREPQSNEAAKEAVKEAAAPATLPVKEIIEAVASVLKPVVARLDAVDLEIKALKTRQTEDLATKAQKIIDETPVLSLSELMKMSVFGKEAQVDGRSALAKDVPVEKAATYKPVTGFPLIDQILANQ